MRPADFLPPSIPDISFCLLLQYPYTHPTKNNEFLQSCHFPEVHRSTPMVYSYDHAPIPPTLSRRSTPMADITDTELQKFLDEGLSQNEIARRTNIPRSTLRRRLEKLS